MRFLLVEDEHEISKRVQRLLHRENYVVDIASDLALAEEAVLSCDYSLIILDRRLPDGDGADLIPFAHRHGKKSRFLIVSALSELGELVKGLDLGADDYIVKPFEPEELVARIRALLRRPLPEEIAKWECGGIEFEPKSRRIAIHGKDVAFSRRELSVLEILLQSAGKVVSRDAIDAAVYGYDDVVQSNSLESHISRIRKVLAQENARAAIHAIRGVGYMIKES